MYDENEYTGAEPVPDPGAPDDEPVEPGEPVPEPKSLQSRLKRNILRFVILFAFAFIVFIGLSVILYPSISNYINTKNASRVIDGYAKALGDISKEDYTAYILAAREYNARLAGSGASVTDAFMDAERDENKTDEYWSLLDVTGNGMMGYVEIELLDIKLPLYHGVSEVVLAQGAGHLHGTSLPVGGESTHATVSAHTGLPRAKLFTGVDTLKTGDTFTMYILDEILTYQVDQILTVLPDEVEELAIVKGGDYVTLVTCTPYGINSHRLLIRGTRIETPPEAVTAAQNAAAEDEEEPGFFGKALDKTVEAFSFVIEKGAQGIVNITEWVMDIFGVEY